MQNKPSNSFIENRLSWESKVKDYEADSWEQLLQTIQSTWDIDNQMWDERWEITTAESIERFKNGYKISYLTKSRWNENKISILVTKPDASEDWIIDIKMLLDEWKYIYTLPDNWQPSPISIYAQSNEVYTKDNKKRTCTTEETIERVIDPCREFFFNIWNIINKWKHLIKSRKKVSKAKETLFSAKYINTWNSIKRYWWEDYPLHKRIWRKIAWWVMWDSYNWVTFLKNDTIQKIKEEFKKARLPLDQFEENVAALLNWFWEEERLERHRSNYQKKKIKNDED